MAAAIQGVSTWEDVESDDLNKNYLRIFDFEKEWNLTSVYTGCLF